MQIRNDAYSFWMHVVGWQGKSRWGNRRNKEKEREEMVVRAETPSRDLAPWREINRSGFSLGNGPDYKQLYQQILLEVKVEKGAEANWYFAYTCLWVPWKFRSIISILSIRWGSINTFLKRILSRVPSII